MIARANVGLGDMHIHDLPRGVRTDVTLGTREDDLRLLALAPARMAAVLEPVLRDWGDVAAEVGMDLTGRR